MGGIKVEFGVYVNEAQCPTVSTDSLILAIIDIIQIHLQVLSKRVHLSPHVGSSHLVLGVTRVREKNETDETRQDNQNIQRVSLAFRTTNIDVRRFKRTSRICARRKRPNLYSIFYLERVYVQGT